MLTHSPRGETASQVTQCAFFFLLLLSFIYFFLRQRYKKQQQTHQASLAVMFRLLTRCETTRSKSITANYKRERVKSSLKIAGEISCAKSNKQKLLLRDAVNKGSPAWARLS